MASEYTANCAALHKIQVSWQLITGYVNQGKARKTDRSAPGTMTGTKPKGAVYTAFKLINPEATSIRVSTGSQLPAHQKHLLATKVGGIENPKTNTMQKSVAYPCS